MKIRIPGLFLRLLFLTASLLFFSGCAQQMKSVQSEPLVESTGNAEIKSIQFSDDATKVEINTDKPIVYTYYMLDTPPRIIVDLAQTTSGTLILPIDVNKGNIKRIDVARHEFGSGILSRIDIALTDKVEVSAALDLQDRKKLVLTLQGAKAAASGPETAVAKAPTAPSAVAAEAAVAPASVPAAAEAAVAAAPAAAADAAVAVAAVPVAAAEAAPAVSPPADKVPVAEEKIATVATPSAEPIVAVAVVAEPAPASSASPVEPPAAVKVKLPPGSPRSLTAITKGAESIEIEISAPVDSFKTFKLSNPDRLVVDIANTKNLITSRQVDVNKFNLGKARIGGTAEKLRVVFDADGGAVPPYQVLKSANGLQIVFGEAAQRKPAAVEQPSADKAAAAPAPVATAVETVAPAVPAPSSPPAASSAAAAGMVDAIEFTQTDGFSQITVRTSGTCVVPPPLRSAKGVQLTLRGCRLPAKLQRTLVTTGFESVIKEIAPYPVKAKKGIETRIAVKLKSPAPFLLKQDGPVWTLEIREPVKPVKMSRPARTPKNVPQLLSGTTAATPAAGMEREFAAAKPEQPKAKSDRSLEEAFAMDKVSPPVGRASKVYTGRKVSLEFSDADIRKIFQLLAEVSNQNFLISDDVTGTISLKLVNVPWDQALDVILENKGLGMQKDGNIVQIRPKTKMKSLDDEAIEMRVTEERKMPLSTVIFDINFATLSEIETQFKNLKSKRNDSSISSDVRTNKIIVVDIEPNIKKMRNLLESLDVPEKQVMIEARIVEASSSFARDIGVKWSFGYTDGSASVANINSVTSTMGGVVSSTLPTSTTGGIATGVSFGKLLSNIQLDMRLSAAATVGQVKIISTPKVLTVNNKPAKISQGQMVPYQNTSSAEGAKTEFIEAALSLEVTPHITADGSVNMKIKASNNSVGSGSPPPINKKEATTELVVKNGETTVIGGIYVDSETEGDTGIPYLSEIPLLGWLFKSNTKNKTKNELLIFITPKIMN